jgi:hypothetical protein
VYLDLVHGNATEPSCDSTLAYVGSLLFDPDFRIVSVPLEYSAGTLRPYPCMVCPPALKLDNCICFCETLFNVAVLLYVNAFVISVAVRE